MSRSFSELDKKIITSLINLDSRKGLNVLGNIIEEYLSDYYYINVSSNDNVSVKIKSDYLDKIDVNDFNSHVSELLLTIVILFDNLVNDRFLYFTGSYEFNSLGHRFVGEDYTTLNIIDTDLMEKVHSYTTRKFFITEDLKEFVKNGYQSKEQVKQAKDLKLAVEQLKYTRIALGFSLLGLVASIVVPILSTSSVTLENELINISSDKATIKYIDHKFDENKIELEKYQNKQNDNIEFIESMVRKELESTKENNKTALDITNEKIKSIINRVDKHENDIKNISSFQEVEKNKHNKAFKSDS